MSVEAEAVYWPEPETEPEERRTHPAKPRIVQFRHRVGEYDVTRLILETSDDTEASGL